MGRWSCQNVISRLQVRDCLRWSPVLGRGHLGVAPVLRVVVDSHHVDPQLFATPQLKAAHHRVAAGLPLQPHHGGHRGVHPASHPRLSARPGSQHPPQSPGWCEPPHLLGPPPELAALKARQMRCGAEVTVAQQLVSSRLAGRHQHRHQTNEYFSLFPSKYTSSKTI